MSKRFKLALIVFVLAMIGVVAWFAFPQKKPSLSVDEKIVEPDVPVASGIQSETLVYLQPESSITTTAPVLAKVEKIADSDLSVALVINADSSSQTWLVPQVKAASTNDSDPGFALNLLDKTGKVTEVIEPRNVVNFSVANKDTLYYQVLNKQGGIIKYEIASKKKAKIIDTLNSKSFGNVIFINQDRLFFIEPTTGKLGFQDLKTAAKTVLAEKAVKNNYAITSAYKFPETSPDKNFIAFLDASSAQTKLIVLPVTAKSFADKVFETDVDLIARRLRPGEKVIKWSSDSRLLQVGDNATVIDLTTKKIIFAEKNLALMSFLSPQGSKVFLVDSEGKAWIKDPMGKNEALELPKDISDLRFMGEDRVIFIIGQRLYTYDIATKTLAAVTETRADFQLTDNVSSIQATVLDGKNVLTFNFVK